MCFSRERDKSTQLRLVFQKTQKFTSDPEQNNNTKESIQQELVQRERTKTIKDTFLHCGHSCQHSLHLLSHLRRSLVQHRPAPRDDVSIHGQPSTRSWWRCFHPQQHLVARLQLSFRHVPRDPMTMLNARVACVLRAQ